jgi:MYXO-CTERM domain-containing protein
MAPRKIRALSTFALGALLLAPKIANAQPWFSAPTDLSSDALWTNYLSIVDLDGDGDLDVIVANCNGFFSSPGASQFQVFTNNGTGTFTNGTAALLGATFSKAVRQFAVGDVTGDGNVDLYVPDAGGTQPDRLFINNGSGVFADEAGTRLPGGLASTAGATRFADFDGNGSLDIFVANGYASSAPDGAKIYLNDGAGNFTEAPALPALSGGQDPDDVDVGDFDRDYDLDIMINMHEGNNPLWLNNGDATFAAGTLPNFPASAFHYGPTTCDVDGDTDLDLWVDNVASGYGEMLLINGGAAAFTNSTAANVSGNPGADDNGVVCVDVNNDGHLDAAIPSLSNTERVLVNDGAGQFDNAGGFPSGPSDPTLWLDFGDLDGDGKLDAVTGQGEGSPRINRVYLGASSAPADTTPPKIIVTETPAANPTTFVRFAVSDNVVTDHGPRLKRAFLKLSSPSTSEIDARFIGGDLFRAEIENQSAGATVTFTACATDRQDNEGCGSPVTYTVGSGGSGGAGGSAGAGTGGSGGAAGGSTGGSAGSGTGGTGTGGTGTGGSAFNPSSNDDGGCGCRVESEGNSRASLGLLLLGLLLARRATSSARPRRAGR